MFGSGRTNDKENFGEFLGSWDFTETLVSLGRLKTVGKAVSGQSQAGSSALLLKPSGKVLKSFKIWKCI